MATIKRASKIETINEIILDEYDITLRITRSPDGSSRIEAALTDPRTRERNELRKFIEGKVAEMGADEAIAYASAVESITAELDRLEAASLEPYGENQGKPRKVSATLWLDTSITDTVVNLLQGTEVMSGVRETIRKSLTTASDW